MTNAARTGGAGVTAVCRWGAPGGLCTWSP